jgi:hypothetical protein
MNVEIGAEAVLFPEKEYISGIFVAVHSPCAVPNFASKMIKIVTCGVHTNAPRIAFVFFNEYSNLFRNAKPSLKILYISSESPVKYLLNNKKVKSVS